MTERAKAKKGAARQERLRAALRENLRRRKAQARGRDSDDRPPERDERRGPEKSGS
jgi:hypothetical protein